MKTRESSVRPLMDPEVVLNLWAYVSEGGYINRLAGKAYVMDGPDHEKLELLRELSATDFLSTPWHPVGKHFTVSNPFGEELRGVAHAQMLSEPSSHAALFGTLMEKLASELPEQLKSIGGDYMRFRLELPQTPLCVTTMVMEHDDGRLEAMVSNQWT